MSVVILGGNECMVRQYKELCGEYRCKAKVYPKMSGRMKDIGNPDLLVLFTNTISHKMVKRALQDIKNTEVKIERSHNSSMSALKSILENHYA